MYFAKIEKLIVVGFLNLAISKVCVCPVDKCSNFDTDDHEIIWAELKSPKRRFLIDVF